MTKCKLKDESDEQPHCDSSKDEETTTVDEEDEEGEDSGNEDDEDFLSEDLNLPETEEDLESDSATDYPVIADDSEEDRIFKRQLAYPPIPMYHPPRVDRQPMSHLREKSRNPRDKIGVLTPMEEVTEPPSSAATSIDGERARRRAGSRCTVLPNNLLSSTNTFISPSTSQSDQKSILKSKECLMDGISRRVTFEGSSSNQSARSGSPTESLGSNTSEYSSMADSGRQLINETVKSEIQNNTIVEEAEETESPKNLSEPHAIRKDKVENQGSRKNSLNMNPLPVASSTGTKKDGTAGDLGLMSDIEQGEKVIQWQMENAKSENTETTSAIDNEFASIVNGIIAELHNLDELIGSFMEYNGVMEMNASKQDHLANVSTQLATYLAQVSPQTIMTNLPQVIPLVTTLLYLTGSNFRSQLASLTAVNVFIERLRDCKAYSGLRILPQADLTWLVRALCELSSESSRSVLKNEGVLALARLIKTAGPEMVFDPILFILAGNDEKVRKKRKEGEDDDRVVIPTGGPGGAPKLKAIALDSLTFALLTFPREDFNLNLVAKLACRCLIHPKRRMRQAALECLSVVSHAMGSHIALPTFRQMIMEEDQLEKEAAEENIAFSISSEGSQHDAASASSEAEVEPAQKEHTPSRIPVPVSRIETDPNGSPKKIKFTGSPISAVSARISRHLLPTPCLNDLVEYALKIPATSKLFSRQHRAVSRQRETTSGGDSGESECSASIHERRIASSSGTSTSSVTNLDIDLEPVLNNIGSGRKKQANDIANSVMAADVSWILAGSGPIKPCEATSVLAPIYKLPDKPLVSDQEITHTHLRQLDLLSSGMESDSNSSDPGYNKWMGNQRMKVSVPNNIDMNSNRLSHGSTYYSPYRAAAPSGGQSQMAPNGHHPAPHIGNGNAPFMPDNDPAVLIARQKGMDEEQNKLPPISAWNDYRSPYKPSQYSNSTKMSHQQDPGMGRGYYQGAANGSALGRGMAMNGNAGGYPPNENGNGRMSSNGSYSLLPNKYSLAGNAMGAVRTGGHNIQHAGGMGGHGDNMMSAHHLPGGTFDYSYGGSMDGLDGYAGSSMNSSDPYDSAAMSLRAPSRAKGVPLQQLNSLRDKYYPPPRHNIKPAYSDEDDLAIQNHSGSSASSDEEEDINGTPGLKADNLKADRRNGQVINKSRNNKKENARKVGKTPKSSKTSPKKNQKENKAGPGEPDKVEQIVSKMQQEYQVYRLELENTGPSPEELAAAKKKRGELDSAGSNSRDSGVSIGAGSIVSVHSPSLEQKTSQQSMDTPTAGDAIDPTANENATNVPGNDKSNSSKKAISDRNSKRKSAAKSVKKSGATNLKPTHNPILDADESLSRNWKSTPDVASMVDDYDPRMPGYRRMSTEQGIAGGTVDHDIINASPYHSATSLNRAGDNYMSLHRKPVLAGRRQSSNRHQEELERQLAMIPTQPETTGRSSRLDYHQQRGHDHHHRNQISHGIQNGYAGMGLLNQDADRFHRVSSMLDMDKAPSRESSAGSGNTYSLLQHDSLHHHHQHPMSSHLRSSKSTGNLLGVDDIYAGIGARVNPYYEMMDHPGSPGRRMLHSRIASHHALADLGNSTDDMEFPMTPQSESSSNTLPKQSRGMINGRMNPKVVPKKLYKGSFREVNARGKAGNMGAINQELFPLDLKPVSSPKHALPAALLQVQASDWETNVDGFRQLVRLARHHPEFIRSDLHNVNMNALRHVMNLRSQVCRAAILFFRELFMNLGKAMEHDSERIAEKLLDKAADTNKFIREDSGKALEALVLHVSPAKALTCLDMYGTRHRNPAVRSMTARMTTKLIEKLGADRCLSEVPERLLPMLCRFLQEGSLDTRMSAKLAFSGLMECSSFDTQLKRHVPADTLRHVQKAMKAITTKS